MLEGDSSVNPDLSSPQPTGLEPELGGNCAT